MSRLALLLLVACSGAQARRIPADPPAPIAGSHSEVQPPAATPASATLTEAKVIAHSHAWYQAFDADDAGLVVEVEGFVARKK